MKTMLLVLAILTTIVSFALYVNLIYNYNEKQEENIKEIKRKQYCKYFKK
jgi:hypothetical protein